MRQQNILIILVAMMLLCVTMQAQQKFTYAYDEAGNRTKRELVSTMALMAAADSSEVENTLDLLNLKELQQDDNLKRQDAFKVQIYPNPSNGIYTIELPELQPNEHGTLQVYSVMGQIVQEYKNIRNLQVVNIASAMPGYYLVKIVVGEKEVAKTLIKR